MKVGQIPSHIRAVLPSLLWGCQGGPLSRSPRRGDSGPISPWDEAGDGEGSVGTGWYPESRLADLRTQGELGRLLHKVSLR